MQKTFVTKNSRQTQKLGEMLAEEFGSGGIICLTGDIGAGKTTFTQGFLEGLGATGPYTSPTFVVMKEYKTKMQNIYHIDAYRIGNEDIIALGWEEIVADNSSVMIVEWAERISDIIPKGALWIDFEWMDESRRKITFRS